jgi:RNA polymerase sigma-70 factor (ECF subfamily)
VDDDRELLERWRAGDRRSGQELVLRYFDSICRFFATKVGAGLEDLVQETFLGCLGGADRWRGDGSFRAWLFGVAHNVLRNHLNAKRRVVVDTESTSARDLGPSASDVIRMDEGRRLLLDALRGLPLDLQIVLELYFWENLSGPEIAAALGVPEGTARSRLRRGREILRERLVASERHCDAALRDTRDDLDRWILDVRGQLSVPALG